MAGWNDGGGKIRAGQINASETVRHCNRAKRRAEIVWARPDQNHLAAAILVNKAGNLRSADAEASRGQPDLHRFRAGFGQLAGYKTKGTPCDVGGHGSGLRCGIIDKFVDHEARAAAKCEYGLVDEHDLHASARGDFDLVTKKDLCSRCDFADIGVALDRRYAHDITAQRSRYADEFGSCGNRRRRGKDKPDKQGNETHDTTRTNQKLRQCRIVNFSSH